MATVYINNTVSKWEASEEEEKIIIEANSAQYKNFRHVPGYQTGAWDGLVRMYNQRSRTLPTGLVEETIEALEEAGYYTEEYCEDIPPLKDREGAEIYYELDEGHQLRCLEAMCRNERGIIHAATNAGKTKIAQAWCALHDVKVLYLVPSKELLKQTVQSFSASTNLDVGYISAEHGWKLGRDVTVCLVSSVAKRKSKKTKKILNQKAVDGFKAIAKDFGAVIVDECHHLTADTWRWVLKQLTNASYRYGLSGSPWEHDNEAEALRVKALLGPVIAEVYNDELIEKGWSAKPTISMIDVPCSYELQLDDYIDIYDEGIVRNTLRNSMIISICREFQQNNETCLIVCNRLEHCEALSDMLEVSEIEHRTIIGGSNPRERDEDLACFKAGYFPVLISTVLSEGVDIPSLNGIILSSGGKSSKQMLQRVGRGLRKKSTGKNEVKIFDFYDNSHTILENHSCQRMKLYEKECFKVVEDNIRF